MADKGADKEADRGTDTAAALEAFLVRHPACALVAVIEARGSTPREAGAWMLAAAGETFGTIGGGQLEWMAIDEARRVLGGVGSGLGSATVDRAPSDAGKAPVLLDIPLGPAIGQCCGGRVGLAIRPVGEALKGELLREARRAEASRPDVLLFGGGHVGHALARALALLPVRAGVVETRAEALEGLPDGVERRLAAVPETVVRAARPGSAFVVLTHDHALDFLLAAEALKRGDAAYVGMIGSKTKKATFRRWFLAEAGGTETQYARLVCPIGGGKVRDKRPAVIAALAAAEIVQALAMRKLPDIMQTA